MNTYENISKELRSYFSTNTFFRLALPFDMFVVYGCAGIMIINKFISLGTVLGSVAYYGFIIGLLLSFANDNKKIMYYGLFAYAASHAYTLLLIIVKYRIVNFSSLIDILVFGGIGYLLFKKDTVSSIISNNKNAPIN